MDPTAEEQAQVAEAVARSVAAMPLPTRIQKQRPTGWRGHRKARRQMAHESRRRNRRAG